MVKRLQIVYHGTNSRSAKCILKTGFRKGTYFAAHLEDAIGYGGMYVFEIAYPVWDLPKNFWQFVCGHGVSPEFIVRLTKYNCSKVVLDNMVLRHRICLSNSTKREIEYTRNDMIVHPSKYSRGELIAYGVEHESVNNP